MNETDHELAAALLSLAEAPGGWEGTASALLSLLPAELRPADATRLSGRLRRITADLAAAGVILTSCRAAGTGRRLVTLHAATASVTPPRCLPAPAAPNPVPVWPWRW